MTNPQSARTLMLLVVIGLISAGCTGREEKSGLAPTNVVVVSSAHGYDLAGAYKFETQFSEMAGFNSPTVSGSAPDGSLVFKPPAQGAPGGVIQIKFVEVKATFAAACAVGATGQVFEITMSDSSQGGSSKTISESSGLENEVALLKFQSDPMQALGDFYIRITSSTAQRDWILTRCDITVTPQ